MAEGGVDARTRIVDVAAVLLREQGPAAVTTRRVAAEAGVQAPTIYRLFGDKDGLLDAVAEHVMAAFVSAKAAVVEAAELDDVDPLEDLWGGWVAQVEFGLANPALFALLSDPARAERSPAAESGGRVLAARIHRIALTGRLAVSEERAADLVRAAGVGTITTLLSTPPDRRDPALAQAMYDAVLAQLLVDPPGRAEAGPRAAAVTLRALTPGLDVLSDNERGLLAEWLDRVIAVL